MTPDFSHCGSLSATARLIISDFGIPNLMAAFSSLAEISSVNLMLAGAGTRTGFVARRAFMSSRVVARCTTRVNFNQKISFGITRLRYSALHESEGGCFGKV